MAPELIQTDDEGKSGLSTKGTDVFALGMVTFEVRHFYSAKSFHVLETPFRFSPDKYHSQSIKSCQ